MNSPRTVSLVIGGLLTVTLVALIGTIVLAAMERTIPMAVPTLGAASVGALGAVLSRTQTATYEDDISHIIVKTRLAALDKEATAPSPVPESAFSTGQAPAVSVNDPPPWRANG